MAFNALNPQSAAEKAVSVIGFGYDICNDIRLLSCKSGPSGSRLIDFDESQTRDLMVPGGVLVPDVPTSIKCDKGDLTRFRSDVLSFNQVISLPFTLSSEYFLVTQVNSCLTTGPICWINCPLDISVTVDEFLCELVFSYLTISISNLFGG